MASRSSPDLPVAHVPGRRLPDVARLAWRQGRIRRMISGICGVDEAGRGPLAGSVVAAAVILHPERAICGLADSKKLSAKRRTQLAQQIRERALAWAVAHASVEEIDRYNILQASLLAMRRAVEALGVVPTEVLIDGVHIPNGLSRPARAIIRGDANVAEISAASILAKTVRDADLVALHQRYPQYGFAQHKGYPTAMHLAALASHGPCAEHRRSFAPVRAVLQQQGVKP